MYHVAQPAGTPAAQILINRGDDPLLIATNADTFINACKKMLHPLSIVGNKLSVHQSSVLGLIGQFFIVLDPAVLHGMVAGAQPIAAALASLVAFLISIGVDFTGQAYASPQEWAAIYDGGYNEFLEYLQTDASLNNVHPGCPVRS